MYTDVGRIAFDANGNGINNVIISQIILGDDDIPIVQELAEFDPQDFKYTTLNPFKLNNLTLSANGRIRSHCSNPCAKGLYKGPTIVACCWTCSACTRQEIVHPSNDKCVVCPPFTAPAQNQTICESIPPDDYEHMFFFFIIYNILALAAIVSLLFIAVMLFQNRNHDIVRDTGIVYCYMLIASTIAGFLTVPMSNNLEPTEFSCTATFFTFCISIVLVNGSLFVKVVSCHLLNYEKISLTSRRLVYEVGFSLLLALLQVYVCFEITLVYQPKPKLYQVFKREHYVEFSCDWSDIGFYFFFSYNGSMLLTAFIMAFINRKFTFNNREVRYIGIVVYANIITWISFTISFFSTNNKMIQKRMSILSAVLANNVLVIVLYFVPKLVHIQKTPKEVVPSPVVAPDTTLNSQPDVCTSNLPPEQKAESTAPDIRRDTIVKELLETPEVAPNATAVEPEPQVEEPSSTTLF
ncbi:metabotropic glutamate receptor 1-like [Physella acuta]|uniref:metabotropic glutamate receptor 1-like n=1 Tax=Physella acuta TaxID=109671 RepID=UPI0027DCBF11|nr:metabotropic glutamate receptor 1-like [Physella acuta]